MERVNVSDFKFAGFDMVRYIGQNGLLIRSKTDLYLYDISKNEVSVKFSFLGRAENEYTFISDFGYENGLVYLYDMNAGKVLWFDKSGFFQKTFLVRKDVGSKPFSSIIKLNENYYLGKRVYGVSNTPELSLYDTEFVYVKDLFSDFKLRSGINLGFQFFKGASGEVLYNRYLSNYILQVSAESINVKYHINFGKNNIPDENNFKDEYEIIDEVNGSSRVYSTFISNICDSKSYLAFMFITKPGKPCLAVFDKLNKTTDAYVFESDKYVITQVVPTESFALVFMEDEEGDYYVSRINY